MFSRGILSPTVAPGLLRNRLPMAVRISGVTEGLIRDSGRDKQHHSYRRSSTDLGKDASHFGPPFKDPAEPALRRTTPNHYQD